MPVKRVDLLIAAFVALAARRPDWDSALVGDGPLRGSLKAQYLPSLEAAFNGWVLSNNLKCWPAFITNATHWYCPATTNLRGIVVTEAAASGLAIVASHVVGARRN